MIITNSIISLFYLNATAFKRTKITFWRTCPATLPHFRLTLLSCQSELSCKSVEQYICIFVILCILVSYDIRSRIPYDNEANTYIYIWAADRLSLRKHWCEQSLMYKYVHCLVREMTLYNAHYFITTFSVYVGINYILFKTFSNSA